MSESMWTLPDVENVRTPVSIMKEQAAALTNQSGGLLYGNVHTFGAQDMISSELRIIVPSLNSYTYTVLRYDQRAKAIYPGIIRSLVQDDVFEVDNEYRFVQVLKDILGSGETRALLTSLLSQAQSR